MLFRFLERAETLSSLLLELLLLLVVRVDPVLNKGGVGRHLLFSLEQPAKEEYDEADMILFSSPELNSSLSFTNDLRETDDISWKGAEEGCDVSIFLFFIGREVSDEVLSEELTGDLLSRWRMNSKSFCPSVESGDNLSA